MSNKRSKALLIHLSQDVSAPRDFALSIIRVVTVEFPMWSPNASCYLRFCREGSSSATQVYSRLVTLVLTVIQQHKTQWECVCTCTHKQWMTLLCLLGVVRICSFKANYHRIRWLTWVYRDKLLISINLYFLFINWFSFWKMKFNRFIYW